MVRYEDDLLYTTNPLRGSQRVPGPLRVNDDFGALLCVQPPSKPPGVRKTVIPPVTSPKLTDSAIEALNLAPVARTAAYKLKSKFPLIVFTSGRRSLAEQASAMASNVASGSEGRKWIVNTYKKTKASAACQKWVDDNPEVTTKNEIAAGLEGVLKGLTDAEAGQISKHLSGEAFDVKPVRKHSILIKKTIRSLVAPTKGKFLDREGGLLRWHAQF